MIPYVAWAVQQQPRATGQGVGEGAPPSPGPSARRRTHVAVVHAVYADLMLRGKKTVECRLSRTRRQPFGAVDAGDVIHFKLAGGGYVALATVGRVEHVAGLTPSEVRQLASRHEPNVLGGRAYWAGKRQARFATLIWLAEVQPMTIGPAVGPFNGGAWKIIANG